MYRILLVDDEALIVDGIADYITKQRPERYDILKAYSGRGALELLGRMRVDVLLTDIEMMGLSGLEVHEQLLSRWPQCRTIFLTAHANFEYVYHAIQDKNARFILKSEGFERVLHLLEHTIAEIDEALFNETLLREARRGEDAHVLKYLFFRGILEGRTGTDSIAEGLARFRTGMRADEPVAMALLRAYRHGAGEGELFMLGNYIACQIGDAYVCCSTQLGDNELVCLLQDRQEAAETSAQIASSLELWQPTFEKICGCGVGIALSARAVDWGETDILLRRLRRSLPEKEDAQNVFVLYSQDEQEKQIFRRERLRRRLYDAFRLEEDPYPAVEALYANLERGEAAFAVAQCLNDLMEQSESDQLGTWAQTVGMLVQAQDAKTASTAISGILGGIQREQSRSRGTRHEKVAAQIDRFIEEHYAQDITLSDIAYHVYLSPAYVSSLYKRLRGVNIMDTVLAVRMAHAKVLLSNGNKQIQQIAAEVGYHSARYFISSFRGFCGQSPNAYRETQWKTQEE